MKRQMGIVGLLAGSAAVANIAFPAAVYAQEQVRSYDIPAQSLGSALTTYSEQSDIDVVFAPELVRGKYSTTVKGRYAPDVALRMILRSSRLDYRRGANGTLVIQRGQGATGATSTSELAADATALESDADIVVTAQKREERLTDVPVPVTVVSAQELIKSNKVSLRDYYSSIPGLAFSPSGQVVNLLSIRGLTAGPGNPTVGVTVDDVPYGAATNNGGGLAVPDLDPGELKQIEVLRGPQGTLYGASSIGGLLKFVTVDPSTAGLSGRAQVGLSTVRNDRRPGFDLRGAVNVPLSADLAVRLSGFTRRDPGYIDNVQTGERAINEQRVSGGRFSALWRPSNAVSLKLSALLQHTDVEGAPEIDNLPGLTSLQQSKLRNSGDFEKQLQAYSATAKVDLGGAELISVTGYNINSFDGLTDYSDSFGGDVSEPIFGVRGASVRDVNRVKKFNQEIRLSGSIGSKVDWLLGGFYTHETSTFVEDIFANEVATGDVAGLFGTISFPSRYREYAIFGNLTYRFTDRFEVQVGGRQSFIRQSSTQTTTGSVYTEGFLGLPSPVILPEVRSRDEAFTYLVTPKWQISDTVMAYARLASGYRTGGPNQPPGVPPRYAPDETENYEVGLKGEFFDRKLTVDASIYYIDWKNVQLLFLEPTLFQLYKANAGKARSQGVELSLAARPVTGLTLSGWIAYNDAELTAGFPTGTTTQGDAGDPLPYSAKWTGHVSAEQRFAIGSDASAFFGGALSYTGKRLGVFSSAPLRQLFPSYTQIDLNAGIESGGWTANLYINNLTDSRARLTGGIGNFPPTPFQIIRPRTMGVTVAKTF